MNAIRQELQFRTLFSCSVACFVSTALLFGISCLRNLHLFYPWKTVTFALWSALSFWQLLAYFWNCLTICVMTIMFCSKISVLDHIPCRYYDICTEIVWKNIRLILFCTLMGGANTSFILSIIAPTKYSSIFSDTKFFMLNHRAHCLISCGAFMGFVFCTTLVAFNRFTLIYSGPQTDILSIIRDHTATRALTTIGRMCYFVPVYALCMKPLSGFRAQLLPFWWFVFDARMIFLMFLVGFHLQFSWGIIVSLLKWQLTKPLEVPLSDLGINGDSTIFSKEFDEKRKHLAVQRLADLVATDQSTRENIFSLNTLGGRSSLWRHISNWCIATLEEFISNSQYTNMHIIRNNMTALSSQPWDSRMQNRLPAAFRIPFRNKHCTTGSNTSNSVTINACAVPLNKHSLFQLVMQGDFHALWTNLCSEAWAIASHSSFSTKLTAAVPYATTAQLFSGQRWSDHVDNVPRETGQSLIWATEILACLTLASYTEDMYGCVQRSLGRILLLFADCLDAVEYHLRLVGLLKREFDVPAYTGNTQSLPPLNATSSVATTTPYRPLLNAQEVQNQNYCPLSSDPTLPWRIHATLAWAVTNCFRQFGDHIESIQVNQKAKDRLRSLRNFHLLTDTAE